MMAHATYQAINDASDEDYRYRESAYLFCRRLNEGNLPASAVQEHSSVPHCSRDQLAKFKIKNSRRPGVVLYHVSLYTYMGFFDSLVFFNITYETSDEKYAYLHLFIRIYL